MTTPTRVVPIQLFTNAVQDFLVANGFRVGDHEIPADRTLPYVILYQISDAPLPTGPELTGPEEDASIGFQITSVGSGRKQAQWQADKIRRLLVGRATDGSLMSTLPAVSAWKVTGRVGLAPSGVVVEGTNPENVLYSVPDRFIVNVTPA